MYTCYTACTEEQKKYILGSNFCLIICFIMPTSIASAKHTNISFFSLFIGAYENCADTVPYLFKNPLSGYSSAPYIEEASLLCNSYSLQHSPEKKKIAYHHTEEQGKLPRDTYPVCSCNHILEPRGRRKQDYGCYAYQILRKQRTPKGKSLVGNAEPKRQVKRVWSIIFYKGRSKEWLDKSNCNSKW